ncbi:PEP-CTERM sorting domain-containing protein [Psychrosphaera haliotis]|nr:PEP-CTERM sorting domain-containing protein [Psychrosphaera haliotis]
MKKLLLASILVAACGQANAGIVSAGGNVSWDAADVNSTPNGGNFYTELQFRQWFVNDNGVSPGTIGDSAVSLYDDNTGGLNGDADWLVGTGELALGSNLGQPFAGNYELTFEFGGIQVVEDPNLGVILDGASNGFLKVYLDRDFSDNAGGYDNTSVVVSDTLNSNYLADATDGDLWLNLEFVASAYTPTFDPNNFGAPETFGIWGNSMFAGLIGGDTNFGFQVDTSSPALANENFDTDFTTYIGEVVDAIGFGLTSQFKATYSRDGNGAIDGITAIDTYSASSSGTVEAFTVSEPGTMALFGLGLLGLAGVARRKA